MNIRTIKQFLERSNQVEKIGQFASDWIEVELDHIEETEKNGLVDDETFCGALAYNIGTLLEVMKDDAPCRAFFLELQILCEPSSIERNTKLMKHWANNPPEPPVILYNNGRH